MWSWAAKYVASCGFLQASAFKDGHPFVLLPVAVSPAPSSLLPTTTTTALDQEVRVKNDLEVPRSPPPSFSCRLNSGSTSISRISRVLERARYLSPRARQTNDYFPFHDLHHAGILRDNP